MNLPSLADTATTVSSKAAESEVETGSKPWVAAALMALFAAHLAFDAFCVPFKESGTADSFGIGAMLECASLGVIVGQPCLLAIAAVFSPARWIARFFICFALIVFLEYATLLGISNNHQNHLVTASLAFSLVGLVVLFLAFQIPVWAVRLVGSWRIVSRHVVITNAGDGGRFTVRGLMLGVSVVCLLAGLGRLLVLNIVAWSETQAIPSQLFPEFIRTAMFAAKFSVPVLPILGAVLTVGRRRWYALVAIVSVVVAFYVTVSTEGKTLTSDETLAASSILLGACGSAFLSFLAIWLCGFRLLRTVAVPQSMASAVSVP